MRRYWPRIERITRIARIGGNINDNYRKKVEKCFALMDAWEFNGKHLMYVPQSGDWADAELRNNYAYSFRNMPHQFHNGGLWPKIA
jgi:hypothetical protein